MESVQTFQFEGSILYDEVGLTCVSSTALNLSLRLAPAVDLTGEDTSGPVDDLVMCEGSDLTLNAFADQNGADETWINNNTNVPAEIHGKLTTDTRTRETSFVWRC